MNSFETLAVFGSLAGLVVLAAAVLVYRTAPDRRVARRFGALLVFEALMIWTTRMGPLYLLNPAGIDRIWLRMHFANDGFLVAAYLPALAVVIRSKLLAPFESSRIVLALFGLAVIHAALVFAVPDLYVSGEGFISYKMPAFFVVQPMAIVIFATIVLSYTYGLIATLLARSTARGHLARRQALILALAFGARDLSWGIFYSLAIYAILTDTLVFGAAGPLVAGILTIGGLLVYVCLTTYGVVSEHLFDIDIKLKWTLERGTIAAIFIAVFFMVSEGATALLSEQFGSLLGILATGALVFALAPLQRAVQKLADHTMPSVRDTPEYKNYKKLQIFSEAVAEALQDGVISPVERVVLNRLRQQLGLEAALALEIESELRAADATATVAAKV